jgi:diguanylate cyclase (GGDEF)-like protein
MSGDTQTCDSSELIRVLEHLPEGVIVLDSDSVILFANKTGSRLIKLKPKKAVGSKFDHPLEDGKMRDFDVELTVKELTWADQPARLVHLKSLKNSGAFHLEWKLEAAVERAREAEEEVESLKAQLAQAPPPDPPSEADTSYYEERITELETLLELAEERADKMQDEIAVDDHQQSQALQDALRQARDAEDQVRQVEEDLEDSRERVRVAEEQAEVAEERSYSLELQLEEFLAAKDEGQDSLEELQTEVEDLRVMVATWRDSVDRLTTEVDEAEARAREAKMELELAEQRIQELESGANEASESKDQNSEELPELQAQLLVKDQELTKLSEQLAEAQHARQLSLEESEELAEQLAMEMEQFEDRAAALEERIAELEGEVESGGDQTEVSAQLEAELRDRIEELAQAADEKAKLLSNISELESQLMEMAETATEKTELEQKLAELEPKLSQAAEQNGGLEAKIVELELKLEELAFAEEERAELESKFAELEPQVEELALAAEENVELAAKLAELEPRLEELSLAAAEKEELQTKIVSLEADLERLNDMAEEHVVLESKVAELESAEREVQSLRKDVRRLENLLENAEELAKKGQKVEKLERKLDGALRRAEEAEERLLEERRLLKELRERSQKDQSSVAAPSGHPADLSGAETERLAFQDELTGLPNRNILHRYLGFMLEQSTRHGRFTVLIRIDCDNFKNFTETFGSHFGDRLLRSVGERLSSVVRGNDVLGRYGEDEFVILLSDIASEEEASVQTASLIRRLYQRMRAAFVLDDQSVQLGVSAGISIYPGDAQNGEQMFEHSAVALRRAKEGGKGQSQFFTAELQSRHAARAELDAQLKKALDQGQFQLMFQPIFDLETSQVIGLETLIRWEHPEHGTLNPESFLQFAEDSGMILLIGNWVLSEALRYGAEWHRHGVGGFLSINLSRRQLMQAELVPSISAMLAQFGCAADRILFEVPEEVTGPEDVEIRKTLIELKGLGVRLAVDNFGTSSTSLQDLRRGPFDVIKVDRKFVHGIPGDEVNTGIVISALLLGYHLGRIAVAVGIENESERKWLANANCKFGQGNALAAPMRPEQVPDFVKRS